MQQTQKKWISSIEIISKTGLSRQTLNNYIKWGLLPKPVVRKPDDPAIKARQLGYFDASVLETIAAIKALKGRGVAMAEIIKQLAGDPGQKPQTLATPSAVNSSKNQDKIIPSDGVLTSLLASPPGFDADAMDEENNATAGYEKDNYVMHDSLKNNDLQYCSFCVLAATLQDAAQVRAEYLPKDYLQLWQRLSHIAEVLVRQYSGQWLVREESSILLYLLMNNKQEIRDHVIDCGLKFLNDVKKLNRYMKELSKNMNNISISIGINTGNDYLAELPTDRGIQIIDAGETTTVALCLSQYAPGGTLWSSKTFINSLPEESLGRIRFGIRTGNQEKSEFMENRFIRIGDLFNRNQQDCRTEYPEIAALPVTEIIEIKKSS
jgi:DNA-binding transcriptional MerR regulator